MPETPKFELEERVCAGGCGKVFRCLPTSDAKYARSYCENICKGKPLTAEQKRRKFPRPKPRDIYITHFMGEAMYAPGVFKVEPEKEPSMRAVPKTIPSENVGQPFKFQRFDPKQDVPPKKPKEGPQEPKKGIDGAEREKLWSECVQQAKDLVKTMHRARSMIVELAFKCCDIEWGGGAHWSGHQHLYTARRFAKEIGVEYKTLMNWLRCWREVVNKLNPGEWKEEDYKFAQRAVKMCGAKNDKVVDTFREQRDKFATSYRMGTIIQWSRAQRSFVQKRDPKDLDTDLLLALRRVYVETLEAIDKKLEEKGYTGPLTVEKETHY